MPDIYLVRHGEDEDNFAGRLNGRRDRPLTKKGVLQAKRTGQTLRAARIAFGAVYCSPLLRARQTVSGIEEELAGDFGRISIMPELIERDFGMLTGIRKDRILELCPDVLRTARINYFLSGEGVESFPETLVRANRVLVTLRADHPKDAILVVSHGDIIAMLIAAHYAMPWWEVLARVYIENSDIVLLPNDLGVFNEKSILLR